MTLSEKTGRTKLDKCKLCGLEIEHDEIRYAGRTGDRFIWVYARHRAPCGAHCAGGSHDPAEPDLHMPLADPCPRCGAENTKRSQIIEKPGGMERVAIHNYTASHTGQSGTRADLERRAGELWQVVARWQIGNPGSFEDAISKTRQYVSWLPEKKDFSFFLISLNHPGFEVCGYPAATYHPYFAFFGHPMGFWDGFGPHENAGMCSFSEALNRRQWLERLNAAWFIPYLERLSSGEQVSLEQIQKAYSDLCGKPLPSRTEGEPVGCSGSASTT